ncbi:ChuX/HutX family heme-like substrate-binding protein [Cerasicoccus arenae]|uniref:Haemin-degrading HemS/ChuX domain-containing protein n=1 Tax=Cerasicoccus arenae TaxID=424488 RepID=A0A8J3DE62_9BACT|nr:ChuX/HutX family heme-like substrate-binding protein [Cerasicoccus arenae]MBK1859883.1 hypothetical protein [Cerasicoccus arenae]GHC08663.1 hypothetical protein GCM10007047_27320 [Cerasicoccus arenae]
MSYDGISSNRRDGQTNNDSQECEGSRFGVNTYPVHVTELDFRLGHLLEELSRLGMLLIFVRNRHCISGIAGCMPSMFPTGKTFSGSTHEAHLHLNPDRWDHAYVIHEQDERKGAYIGIEFFDARHNALFRAALTPNSEGCEMQQITQQYYQRCVPVEEMAGWTRMAELSCPTTASHLQIDDNFIQKDPWSAPFDMATTPMVKYEAGFSGGTALARTILEEAKEEKQELILTVGGGFGRMNIPFSPSVVESVQRGWSFAGGNGGMLRLNPSAVATYWVGSYEDTDERYSYLEAVDCFGDLILRINSYNPDAYHYWCALAKAAG